MWPYVTVLLTALLLPSQVIEANSPYRYMQHPSVNETNCITDNSVASAVSAFENSYPQEDENGVEIIKSVELDSSSVDFLMNIPGNDMSWVDSPPPTLEHEYKNEKYKMNLSLIDTAEFIIDEKEPFTASASEDAPSSIINNQTADNELPIDFDFQSRILIGNLLLRENKETTYTPPSKSTPQNVNITENYNFSGEEIISSSQENDHKQPVKLETRKRKKSRPFNHWDFGRRTKPPKNLTKEQILFHKVSQPVITIPFKDEEETNQYSLQQLQNTPMYVKNPASSNAEEHLPYIQQNSLQSQQVPATDSDPYSVTDSETYSLINQQQIPLKHHESIATGQEEQNYYSGNTGYTPQLFFVARYVPGYKIIPQPVVLNTQGHHTTTPVYVNTPPVLQHYPLIVSQSSQTPIPVHRTE